MTVYYFRAVIPKSETQIIYLTWWNTKRKQTPHTYVPYLRTVPYVWNDEQTNSGLYPLTLFTVLMISYFYILLDTLLVVHFFFLKRYYGIRVDKSSHSFSETIPCNDHSTFNPKKTFCKKIPYYTLLRRIH